jgi:ribonuclease BN (tRNA processing enzyme)
MVHEATFDDRSAQMAIPRGHSTARMVTHDT